MLTRRSIGEGVRAERSNGGRVWLLVMLAVRTLVRWTTCRWGKDAGAATDLQGLLVSVLETGTGGAKYWIGWAAARGGRLNIGISNVGTRSRRGRTRLEVALDMAEEDVIAGRAMFDGRCSMSGSGPGDQRQFRSG